MSTALVDQAIFTYGDKAAKGFDRDAIASALVDIAEYAGLTVTGLHPDDVDQIVNTYARWH